MSMCTCYLLLWLHIPPRNTVNLIYCRRTRWQTTTTRASSRPWPPFIRYLISQGIKINLPNLRLSSGGGGGRGSRGVGLRGVSGLRGRRVTSLIEALGDRNGHLLPPPLLLPALPMQVPAREAWRRGGWSACPGTSPPSAPRPRAPCPRLTGPPPMRQLTSMRRGPRVVYFASTWNTPSLRSRAFRGVKGVWLRGGRGVRGVRGGGRESQPSGGTRTGTHTHKPHSRYIHQETHTNTPASAHEVIKITPPCAPARS